MRLVPCSPSPLTLRGFVVLNPRAAEARKPRRWLRITDASSVDRDLFRLRGTGIEGQAQAEGELQEEQRRVSDAMLRRKAEQQVLARSLLCVSH